MAQPSMPESVVTRAPQPSRLSTLPWGALIGKHTILLITLVLTIYPTSMLVWGSFSSAPPGAPAEFTLDNYVRALTEPFTYRVLVTSLVITTLKTVVSLILGVFLAWVVARSDTPLRNLIEVLAPLPYFAPGLLTAIGWAMLGNPTNGSLNLAFRAIFGVETPLLNIYSMGGIIFVMAAHSASFVYLMMVGTFRTLDLAMEEASRTSGANGRVTFRRVTLPLVAPTLGGVALLGFISGLESFEVPQILGTPAGIFVFTNQMYYYIRGYTPARYGDAMALGIVLTVLTLVLVVIQWKLLAGRDYTTITGKGYRPQPVRLGRWGWPVTLLALGWFGLTFFLPFGQIVYASLFQVFGLFSPELFTLNNYTRLLNDPLVQRGFRNTVIGSASAALICMILCSLIAYVRTRTRFWGNWLLELSTWLPWTLPGIVLGLAMLWAYIRIPGPIVLYGTLGIMMIAWITKGLPLGVRQMNGAMMQLGKELEESSRVHGGSWLRTYRRIVLPLLRPGFVAGWFLLAIIFARELSTSVLLYSFGNEVLAVLILGYWETGRGPLVASLSTMMLAFMATLVVLEMLVRPRPPKERTQPSQQPVASAPPHPANVPVT